jgi:hypothetical protein
MTTWVEMGIDRQWFDANGDPLSGGVLKVYEVGTTTPVSIAIDALGSSPQASITLNANGVPEVSGNEVVPYIDRDHKWAIFANATHAAADTPALYGFFDDVKINPFPEEAAGDYDDLRAYSPNDFVVGNSVIVTDSGIGGVFKVSSGSATDDGGTIITNATWNAASKHWERIYSGYVSVEWFGADKAGVSDSTAAFNAAKAVSGTAFVPDGTYDITGTVTGNFVSDGTVTITTGTVNYIATLSDSSGELTSRLTPTGEVSALSVKDAVLTTTGFSRSRVTYVNATSVHVNVPENVPMAGFRFAGSYKKSRVPLFASGAASSIKTVTTASDLGAESAVKVENWYGIFACADDGGTIAYKLMPFLRVGSIASDVVTLNAAGEGVHTTSAATYSWSSTDNLAGTDCLIINETINSRANSFSGRVTTITANTSTTVTLSDEGTVAALDFLLPAPPGYDHYVYLGSFYYDTAEVRNIADTGSAVKAKMINSADPNYSASGSIASAVQLRWGGYICPLATAAIVKDTFSLSTASLGQCATAFWHDSGSHEIEQTFTQKEATATTTHVSDNITLPFGFDQSSYYLTFGSLDSSRASGSIEIKGWIEI